MPGNLAAANPQTVLPGALCSAFQRSDEYHGQFNVYKDGTSQRAVLVDSGRASWSITQKLTPAMAAALTEFFLDRDGSKEPFYFYDPYDVVAGTAIGSNYDSGGVNEQGRFVVRFKQDLKSTVQRQLPTGAFELIEVA